MSLGTGPGILHRITDQIHPNLTQHRLISFYDRQRTDHPGDVAAFNLRLQISDHLLDELIQIHFSDGGQILATVHPSSLLRIEDESERREARARFVQDLKVVVKALRRLPRAA